MELLDAGAVDLATVQADARTSPSARIIAVLYTDAFQLVVREDSEIFSVADLAGRKIAIPLAGGGQHDSFWFLMSHYGLTADDLRALPMSPRAASWAMAAGAVDGVFRVRSPGNPSILELTETVPSRLVPITQAAAMRIRHPALDVGMVPAGSYRGHPPLPPSDLPTVGVKRLLVASENLDRNVARTITAALFQRRRDLVAITPVTGFIAPPATGGGTFLPIHPGALSFYDRDQPSFLQENAEPIALFVTIFVLMASGILQLASRRKKRRIDDYNRSVLHLGAEAPDLTDLEQVRASQNRLFEIGGQVVDDAEVGLISPEGFDFFSFTWEMVNDRVERREQELSGE
jgi:TRAP transporter TAXI family solute receptor